MTLLLPPAPPEAEREYDMKLVATFEAIDSFHDPVPLNILIESLNDYEWIVYQRWRSEAENRAERNSRTDSWANALAHAMSRITWGDLLPILETMKQAIDTFASIRDLNITPKRITRLESEIRYALARHPFGKNHKGRKKWEKRNQ